MRESCASLPARPLSRDTRAHERGRVPSLYLFVSISLSLSFRSPFRRFVSLLSSRLAARVKSGFRERPRTRAGALKMGLFDTHTHTDDILRYSSSSSSGLLFVCLGATVSVCVSLRDDTWMQRLRRPCRGELARGAQLQSCGRNRSKPGETGLQQVSHRWQTECTLALMRMAYAHWQCGGIGAAPAT